MPMDPLTLMLIGQGIQAGGAIAGGVGQQQSNRETRKQNRYMRRLSDKENAINELEYNQNRPYDLRDTKIDSEMKRLKYLEFLRGKGVL